MTLSPEQQSFLLTQCRATKSHLDTRAEQAAQLGFTLLAREYHALAEELESAIGLQQRALADGSLGQLDFNHPPKKESA